KGQQRCGFYPQRGKQHGSDSFCSWCHRLKLRLVLLDFRNWRNSHSKRRLRDLILVGCPCICVHFPLPRFPQIPFPEAYTSSSSMLLDPRLVDIIVLESTI